MNKLDSKLSEIVNKYNDYMECDEYHVHDGTDEHEGSTPLPHDFDEDKLMQALKELIEQEKVAARLKELEDIPKVPLYLFGAKKGVKVHLSEGETKAVNAARWIKDRISELVADRQPPIKSKENSNE